MKIAIIPAALLAVAASVHAQDTTFDFVTDDGGKIITGWLTLNSPYSPLGGGSVKDIVGFSVTDPHNTFTLADLFTGGIVNHGSFTWNPLGITAMDLTANTFAGGLVDEKITFAADGLDDAYLFLGFAPDGGFVDSGSWKTTVVPDAGSSAALLGMALAGLGALRRSRR
jgi:hypothetical protein